MGFIRFLHHYTHFPYTLLVIEDNTAISENLAQVLTFEGFTLLTAARGSAGLQLAKRTHPDLIICDLLLPEMDGFELISRLRDDANTADIPIIVVSALVEPEHAARAEKLGASHFLRKPFQLENLIEVVYQALGT